MIKVFPFYKGKNIASNPFGYTNKTNARKRMDNREVMSDFLKTLPADYWFEYLYTFHNNKDGKTEEFDIRRAGEEIEVLAYDINTQVYVKDIEDKEIVSLLYEMFKMFREKRFWERTDEEYQHMCDVALRISSLGYYPYCWKDETDFKARYSKYVTKNVEFKEMDVEVTKTEIH